MGGGASPVWGAGGEKRSGARVCVGVWRVFSFSFLSPPMLQKVMSVVEVSGSAVLLYL